MGGLKVKLTISLLIEDIEDNRRHIFTRKIIEKFYEFEKEVYICFIDLS